ncbi:hypothetical protein V2O64_09150 [Verrucomicrobiaceae bacterium 227]
MNHRIKIKSTGMLNHNVKRFVTTKPEGFSFEPGQATNLHLLREGYRSKDRPFTFTSTPADDHLEFTIKLYYEKDGVTDEMSSLEAGEEFEIGDSWGAINYEGPGTFIAGGAGITPFISIFRDLDSKGQLDGNHLWFSNSTPKDIFLESELKSRFPGDQLKLIVTDSPEGGAYQEGVIDTAFLKEHLSTLAKNFVYLCGPPAMTKEIIADLKNLGIEDAKIIHEDFD